MRDTLILAQKAEASSAPQLPTPAIPADAGRKTEKATAG
jgi:hypothetical protein